MRELLNYGDRLTSVNQYRVTDPKVRQITVDRLPGPEAYFLVAVVTFNGDEPDLIIPLQHATSIEVQNP